MPEDVRPRVRLFGELLAHWARERPADTALIFGDRSWTWAEFDERVRRLSGALAGGRGRPGRPRSRSSTRTTPPAWRRPSPRPGRARPTPSSTGGSPATNWPTSLKDSGAKVVFVGAELVPARRRDPRPAARAGARGRRRRRTPTNTSRSWPRAEPHSADRRRRRRRRADHVHQRHHRLPEGRGADPPQRPRARHRRGHRVPDRPGRRQPGRDAAVPRRRQLSTRFPGSSTANRPT